MSVMPRLADLTLTWRDFRFGPNADVDHFWLSPSNNKKRADVLSGGRTAGLIVRNDARLTFGKHRFHSANQTAGFEGHFNGSAELLECAR